MYVSIGDRKRRMNNVSRDGSKIMRKIQKPKFYWTINGGENIIKVRIPSSFRERAKKYLSSGSVTLQGPSGVEWVVWLCDKGEYLEEGWESFFHYNKLEENDFLLFTVLKGSTIEVEVFRDGLAINYEEPQNDLPKFSHIFDEHDQSMLGRSDAHFLPREKNRKGKEDIDEVSSDIEKPLQVIYAEDVDECIEKETTRLLSNRVK